MVEPRHLKNAPIVEAVVDFRAVLPSDFKPEKFREAKDRLSRDYPKYSESKGFETGFQISLGKPVEQRSRDLGVQGVSLRTEDEKTVAQFRADGFTLNRLRPYTDWETHIEPEALRLWDVYLQLAHPVAVTRIALRYINQIAMPPEGRLEDFILTGPRLPQSIPAELSGFATQVLLINSERRIAASVTQVLEVGAETPAPSLLLDIDVYSADDNSPMQGDDLLNVLRNLRAYKNEIFFGSLTPTLVETFE